MNNDNYADAPVSKEVMILQDEAICPTTPSARLIELARHPNEDVRYWAAMNRSMPAEVLIELATDKHFGIRYAVSQNPSAPVEALVKIIESIPATELIHTPAIQRKVAENPNCPEAVKMWLKAYGYAGMTLAEFIMATHNGI